MHMECYRSGLILYDRSSSKLLYVDVSTFTSGHSKQVGCGDLSTATVEILLEL